MNDVYNTDRIAMPPAPPEYADSTGDAHFVPAPCQVACPVGTDAPSYLAYIWEEKWAEAFEAITATNPFSSICGRVCDAPCEPACRRAASDGPIAIRNLKRTVMERLGREHHLPPVEVSRKQTIGIVGAGPAGLVAAHDLAVAGFAVHVYEMSDRPGGMMVWGIPAFRLPAGVVEEDMERLFARCPGIELHLNTALGRDVTLDELKARHDAVLLTIGSWWGKPMGIPGEEHEGVVDGVGFLRRVNGGERPALPETVVVIGGGDVAMDACRVAKRLPGCKHVKVVYRRGPEEIPARRDELEGAVREDIEFVYNTQQVRITPEGDGLVLRCVRTVPGEPDPEDGRRRPVVVEGSEHDIPCGMVIAAVGQQAACEELDRHGMMLPDRVRADYEGMRTGEAKIFAAGDGAFGGSTIVVAMNHGQRAAYYIRNFLDGIADPLPWRTPWRTRQVPVAQDLNWELWPRHEQAFHGLGDDPVAFPEIESAYDVETARAEAARCYRCDAETGSTDYSVRHREDIFSMARTSPLDQRRQQTMLAKRLQPRDNPFPAGRPASVDDLVFLPANLSRLVIDPYREACRIDTRLAGKLELPQPFMVTGFDDAPAAVRREVSRALAENGCPWIGATPPEDGTVWIQLVAEHGLAPEPRAAGLVWPAGPDGPPAGAARERPDQILGLSVDSPALLETAIPKALEGGFDLLLLEGNPGMGRAAAELPGWPDLTLLRETIRILREMRKEEAIDIVWFGGVRSGTDAAKLIALGANALVLGMAAIMAAGGEIADGGIAWAADRTDEERSRAVVNILNASAGEASMMARCTGKTKLCNVEPEDLRAITLATADATGMVLAGTS